MPQQTKNSCAKAFGNRSRNKNLKPKKSRGGVRLTPLMPFRVKAIVYDKVTGLRLTMEFPI